MRLRERGAGALDDLELLELLLGTAAPLDDLWFRFRGLAALFAASPESLRSVPGATAEQRERLLVVRELVERLERPRDTVPPAEIDGSEAAYAQLAFLAREPQEVVVGLFLDARNRRLSVREIFRGSVDGAHARPREILAEALRANAARLVVAHNHPSQDPTPSEADARFTTTMRQAASAVGLPLLDHLIVCAGGRYYSFADAGWVSPPPDS